MRHLPHESIRNSGTKNPFLIKLAIPLVRAFFLFLLASIFSVLCRTFPIRVRKPRVLHETLDFILHSGSLFLGIYGCFS